ncbi:hypothetical protein MVEN_02272600 [Mycena venus]|uniref:DUF6533 domain-containing protein n=1 Tax=Mycena venus TaxID=2733690 RepID=A0A8H6X5C3_9AGAR|nr:hypothetical protein MVEN_02272600 [Mycena venus]
MAHYSIDAADDTPLLDPATFAWDLRLYRSVVLAGLVLLIYDYTLTLATEVKFIWAAKLRPSIYWFPRAALSHEVRVLCSLRFRLSTIFSQSCAKMQLMWRSLIVIQEMLIECTLIMRVFAMYGRNWWILICLVVVSALWPAFTLWHLIKAGIPQIYSVSGISGTSGLAGAWVSQSVCDILVFLLTVRRAFVQREMYPRYTGTLLWRMTADGAVYFGIIIIANVANLATFYLCDDFCRGSSRAYPSRSSRG